MLDKCIFCGTDTSDVLPEIRHSFSCPQVTNVWPVEDSLVGSTCAGEGCDYEFSRGGSYYTFEGERLSRDSLGEGLWNHFGARGDVVVISSLLCLGCAAYREVIDV